MTIGWGSIIIIIGKYITMWSIGMYIITGAYDNIIEKNILTMELILE
jgi:hypothetical protein